MIKLDKNLKDTVTKDQWRNQFHIQAPTGLLNDPNGLIYHEGIYHVFYQWHPDAPVHGLKYWNHVTSKDLVHWEQDQRIIEPNHTLNLQGAYSGSAWVLNNEVCLFYTGNTRDEDGVRHPYQLRSVLEKEAISEPSVLIDGIPEGYTDHFRDPKVFKVNNQYLMVIGAQKKSLEGAALVYTSTDGLDWTFGFELKTDIKDKGFMWECPDIFSLDIKDVFLFCPQGSMNEPIHKRNVYPSAYVIGNFNLDQEAITNHSIPKLVDYGFDFYAPQTFDDDQGKKTLFAWLGMPEIDYPSDANGWAHVLSIPRVLSVEGDSLYQLPHPNLKALRKDVGSVGDDFTLYEMRLTGIEGDLRLSIYQSVHESLEVHYDSTTKKLTLDRSQMVNQFGQEFGTKREIDIEEGLHDLWIYRDTSTVEIFINRGRYTMSTRFFPLEIQGRVIIDGKVHAVELYHLEDVNHDL